MFFYCNSISIKNNPNLEGKKLTIDAVGVDLDSIQPLKIVCTPETKQFSDELHITSASMDSHYASETMCSFRGRLFAIILKILLASQMHYQTILDGSTGLFLQTIREFVARCSASPERPTASVACVSGRLTMKSYTNIPKKVARYCVDEFLRSSSQGSTLIPLHMHREDGQEPSEE